jgi:hypothetical protein
MQTILTINDQLFEDAANIVSIKNPNLLIEIALKEFIKNHQPQQKRDIRELVGKVEIDPDYDYKKLRIGE